jgi:crotonobetainyl-CoA:carnitine CoA-transferase CaiB-like acyl-CoA transferase
MSITGDADGGPARSGASVMDMSSGIAAYGAIVTALLARERSGRGQKVGISLLQTALALLGTHGAAWLNAGVLPQRAGSGVSHLAPYGAFQSADGDVVIGVLNDDSWQRLCRELDAPDLAEDPRYRDMPGRVAHRRTLQARIESVTRTRTTAAWCARLSAAGIVASPVHTLAQAFAHPQVAANGIVHTVGEGDRELRLVGAPMRFSAWQPAARDRPPPALGEHTGEVLHELGYATGDVDALRARGAV